MNAPTHTHIVTQCSQIFIQVVTAVTASCSVCDYHLLIEWYIFPFAFPARVPYSICKGALHPDPDDPDAGTGYAPFNTDDGAIYLGLLDSTFLGAYTVGLFISGILGDILDLRLFLTMGMLSTSGFLALFGVAGVLQIHVIYWFFACNVLAGLCQSSGWPACVTAMSRYSSGKKHATPALVISVATRA